MFDLGEKIWLQSYIRPVCADRSLRALMEFAGEGLISFKSSRDQKRFRLASPRSDLSRHQSHINLRNLFSDPILRLIDRLRGASHVVLLVRPIVRQQRPHRARHLVG